MKFFAVTSVDTARFIAYGDEVPMLISWVGNPTFPVTARLLVVECSNSGFECHPGTLVVHTRENPIRWSHYCYGSGGLGTGTFAISLVDRDGHSSNPVEYTVTCY